MLCSKIYVINRVGLLVTNGYPEVSFSLNLLINRCIFVRIQFGRLGFSPASYGCYLIRTVLVLLGEY